jgi:16S rRNA (uracil1498-N3)-methyltransferase
MGHRCYSETPIAGDRAELGGSEAHHLLHVLRAAPGTQVTLFDGSGCELDAEVTACRRSTVELAIHERREVDRELPFSLTLGVPLPKGDRQRWLVEKAVELGVTQLVPLHTERAVATGEKAGDKLDRYVIEASKQCGRNRLMAIAAPQSWEDWLAAPADARRWVADPAGRLLVATDLRSARTRTPALIAVGPEGGFTAAEVDAAEASGWDVVSLGPRILRIETAAMALATLVATMINNSDA